MKLKEICHADGVLLIPGGVMTDPHASYNGWHGIGGVAGDLTTLGKVIPGGLPAAAFDDRRDAMEYLVLNSSVYQAGILSSNPTAMVAGLVNLGNATKGAYDTAAANADRLATILPDVLTKQDMAHRIRCADTMLSSRFVGGEGHNSEQTQAADTFRHPAFFHALLTNGVYPLAPCYETWSVPAVLTDADLEIIECVAARAVEAVAVVKPE